MTANQTLSSGPCPMTEEEIRRAGRDGYHAARQLFGPDEVALIRDTFMDAAKDGPIPGLSEIQPQFTGDDPLSFYPRMMHPADHPEIAVGPLALKYMLDRRLYEILKILVEDEPVSAQSMFYFKPPGARGQSMHQDNYYLRVKPGTCMAAWIAIDDADADNGGMKVIPGTHEMEVVCPGGADSRLYFTRDHIELPGKSPVHVDLRAGDCLFFNGSLVHGSSPNTSRDRFRRSLIFHYLPASSLELAAGYANPRRFDGSPAHFIPASGGGPCGGETAMLPKFPH